MCKCVQAQVHACLVECYMFGSSVANACLVECCSSSSLSSLYIYIYTYVYIRYSRSLETSGCHPHPRPAIPLCSYMRLTQRWWKASLKTASSPMKVTRTIIPLFRTQPLMLIVVSARADVDLRQFVLLLWLLLWLLLSLLLLLGVHIYIYKLIIHIQIFMYIYRDWYTSAT